MCIVESRSNPFKNIYNLLFDVHSSGYNNDNIIIIIRRPQSNRPSVVTAHCAQVKIKIVYLKGFEI